MLGSPAGLDLDSTYRVTHQKPQQLQGTSSVAGEPCLLSPDGEAAALSGALGVAFSGAFSSECLVVQLNLDPNENPRFRHFQFSTINF